MFPKQVCKSTNRMELLPVQTNAAIRQLYPSVPFCGLQNLLNYEIPVAYTVRREGWAADIYDMGGGVAIVTGYAPFGNIRPSYELRERYETQAEKIRYDYSLSYEQQQESLKSLARDFIKGVCNYE